MAATLEQIVAEARVRVTAARAQQSLEALIGVAEAKPSPHRRFRDALRPPAGSGGAGLAIIAELKQASPSRGMIRGSFPVASLAARLQAGGARALSVLTEEKHFAGSLANLDEAAAATGLPCLRKDFIIDEYQIYEARLHAASAVLLIVAALTPLELAMLLKASGRAGLDALVEVHDENELATAIDAGAEIIGVNSRDLKTLQVDMETHARLAARIPAGPVRVAESGIRAGSDLQRLKDLGYDAALIGESLMAADDPGAALLALRTGGR